MHPLNTRGLLLHMFLFNRPTKTYFFTFGWLFVKYTLRTTKEEKMHGQLLRISRVIFVTLSVIYIFTGP